MISHTTSYSTSYQPKTPSKCLGSTETHRECTYYVQSCPLPSDNGKNKHRKLWKSRNIPPKVGESGNVQSPKPLLRNAQKFDLSPAIDRARRDTSISTLFWSKTRIFSGLPGQRDRYGPFEGGGRGGGGIFFHTYIYIYIYIYVCVCVCV